MRTVLPWCVLAAALLLPSMPAQAGDHLFDSGFDDATEGPHSDAEAARFLTQATFGPTLAEIRRLRAIGYHAWLDEQFTLPPSLHRPYLDDLAAAGYDIYHNHRREVWWTHAVTAPDQLRQRIAFALSELLVVSDQNGAIEGFPIALANYYDHLVEGSFGNYRDLLEQVTLSPVMGHYLSMFKNRKPDAELNIRPDENYAREIMQLFSVGLVQLNPDGTPVLAGGERVPTYDQETIRGFAHVFTGWNWANCPRTDGGLWWQWEWCPPGGEIEWPNPGWDAGWYLPMEAWEQYHASEGSKQLLVYPGVVLPDGVLPAGGTAQSDLDAALDNIFAHPNVGPFIARHLIKRLVTSNPSPAYVGRVAAAFGNNGLGVRGDLEATVRAVLLDTEARTLAPASANAGKLREPLLRLSHLWRALDARADDGRYREWWNDWLGQNPLGSPTVFNFFLPDYRPPGELSQLGLDAPEFQITTDTTIASVANGLGGKVYWHWRGQDGEDPEDVRVNLEPEIPFAADPVRLVDRYDLLFMNRTMSDGMFRTLVDYLRSRPGGNADELRDRVQDAVWLIQSSPEYVIER